MYSHSHIGTLSVDVRLCLFRWAGEKWAGSTSEGSKFVVVVMMVVLVIGSVVCDCEEGVEVLLGREGGREGGGTITSLLLTLVSMV